ncbi:hypothetical protein M2480_000294 [Parabacteroides sp. PFB2-12]|nr:hypothetical protein [Parabacteroides sp. PM6-13]MDH6389336.1 hypothetical protein [Parabacteroides sp. PFB2-12]
MFVRKRKKIVFNIWKGYRQRLSGWLCLQKGYYWKVCEGQFLVTKFLLLSKGGVRRGTSREVV